MFWEIDLYCPFLFLLCANKNVYFELFHASFLKFDISKHLFNGDLQESIFPPFGGYIYIYTCLFEKKYFNSLFAMCL